MKRRDSLKAITLSSLGFAALNPQEVLAEQREQEQMVEDAVGGKLRHEILHDEKLMKEVFFTPAEMATITILSDIIIPADAVSGSASAAGVPAFIEFIVKDMPQHQTPMRGGLRWLDVESAKRFGKPFREISASERIKIVDDIAYPNDAKPEHSQGVAFFSLMRNLTATGFYTSQEGIKDIGYIGNTPNQWNGVPADVLKQYGLTGNE